MAGRYLKIRNWEKWQSYRSDRGQPPWIKIHREVMRNYDWLVLTDAQKGQLVCLWVLAADKDGKIPASPHALKKVCSMDTEPDLQLFIERGFIEPDAAATSPRRHDDANATPQKQAEASRVEQEAPRACAREDDTPPEVKAMPSRTPATEAQVDQLEALEESTGVTRDQVLPDHYHGQPLTKRAASVAIDRLMQARDRARASPETFGQAKRRRTDEATAELLKEMGYGSDDGDLHQQGSGDDRLRIDPGPAAGVRQGSGRS